MKIRAASIAPRVRAAAPPRRLCRGITMAGFFNTRWQSQTHVGGLHPASSENPRPAAELHRQFQMVHDALNNEALNPCARSSSTESQRACQQDDEQR